MAASRDALTVGGRVGDTYRVTRLLGQGGMGAVWCAEHLRLPGRQVAIKVLLSTAATSGEAFARFRREAEIASRLGHPHIVEVFDFHTLPDGQPYIVLEYLQGETLARRLRRGKLPPEEALTIARQVASALAAAHRAGVVHRDLKPDNIWLCAPGDEMPGINVKVLDFGISKIRGSQTVATQDAVLMGTPQYMAPEQAAGRNTDVDARTDLFALGAIVHEMLCGEPAFAGGSLAEVVYKVVHGTPASLGELEPGLPRRVVAAVEHALAKDAAARPADMSAFVEELTGRPLSVLGTPPPEAAATARVPLQLVDVAPTATPGSGAPLPSGAASPRVSAALPRAHGRSRWLVRIGAGMAVAAAAGVVVVRTRPAPVPASLPPPAPPTLATPLPEPVALPRRVSAAVAAAAPATTPEPRPATPRPADTRPTAPARSVPPEVAGLLREAEQALRVGDPARALRLVDQSFYLEKTGWGWAVKARAHCRQKDLGAARAASLNVVGPLRAVVVRDCLREGIDLRGR